MSQKACGTLASSKKHRETVDQLMSLAWRAVILCHLKTKPRTTPKVYALIAKPYVRTELQFRIAWRMTGMTMGKNDSEERKRSKEEKMLLMTHLRDLMICDEAPVACAELRDALCFVRFMLEQM